MLRNLTISKDKSRSDGNPRVIAGLTRNLQRAGDAGIRRHDGAIAAKSLRDLRWISLSEQPFDFFKLRNMSE